jgi:hypothetical protein
MAFLSVVVAEHIGLSRSGDWLLRNDLEQRARNNATAVGVLKSVGSGRRHLDTHKLPHGLFPAQMQR